MNIDTYALIYTLQFPVLFFLIFMFRACGFENYLLRRWRVIDKGGKERNKDAYFLIALIGSGCSALVLSSVDIINFFKFSSDLSFSAIFSKLLFPLFLIAGYCVFFFMIAYKSSEYVQQFKGLRRILTTGLICLCLAGSYVYALKSIKQYGKAEGEATNLKDSGVQLETLKRIDQFFFDTYSHEPPVKVIETEYPSAYTGYDGISISRGLVQSVTDNQFVCALAHEAEHYYAGDQTRGTTNLATLCLLPLLFILGCYVVRKYVLRLNMSDSRDLPVSTILMIFFAFLPIMQAVINADSRRMEYAADSSAVEKLIDNEIPTENLKAVILKVGKNQTNSLLTYYLFFTHPTFEERSLNIDKKAAEYQLLKAK